MAREAEPPGQRVGKARASQGGISWGTRWLLASASGVEAQLPGGRWSLSGGRLGPQICPAVCGPRPAGVSPPQTRI